MSNDLPTEETLSPGAVLIDTSEADRQAGRKDLKRKTAHGAFVSAGAQGASFLLRICSMVILARLLSPADFGLVGMVTAITGFLGLFKDAGLSMAAVQSDSINQAQVSTLFWINLAVGGALFLLCAAISPALVVFYGEPRLLWVTVALGSSFLFNGAAAQHRAMLQRQMRFGVLALIDVVSLFLSIAASIALAVTGAGYWAIVAMTVGLPANMLAGVWLADRWMPGAPRGSAGIWSMVRYGGTVTLNSVVVYLAYNAEKVLLGKFLGAATLGMYGRAYQLINLPTESLNSTIGGVAFPALCRVQSDPPRLRSYFLKGYGLFLSLVMPITMGCALFAEEIIRVALGPQWNDAARVFRLLAPTIAAFALINPFAWLMLANGNAVRSLKIALMIAPVVILGYLIGLKYGHGPQGVATGFSAAMLLLVAPVILWAKQGTLISTKDVLNAVARPVLSIAMAAAIAFALREPLSRIHPPLLRLVLSSSVLFGSYFAILLFVMKQKAVYMELFRSTGLWPLRKAPAREPVS